jgi:hypothetical protein
MAELKYAKNIITDTKPMSPEALARIQERMKEKGMTPGKSTVKSTRLLWLDDEVAKGAFYMELLWFWEVKQEYSIEEPHVHDFDEIIGFVGTNREDPHDLGGEVEIWLDDEKHVLTKSCLVFIPKGLKHCPLLFTRIDSPICWFTIGNSSMYTRDSKE